MFLQDLDGNYIDVPVLVKNLRVETPEINGDKELPPNAGFAVSDKWKLSRRFFIFDTMSGVVSTGDSTPSVVRWANEINLKIELDLDTPESIYRPYLIIDYKETKPVADHISPTPVTFTVEYFMNYGS